MAIMSKVLFESDFDDLSSYTTLINDIHAAVLDPAVELNHAFLIETYVRIKLSNGNGPPPMNAVWARISHLLAQVIEPRLPAELARLRCWASFFALYRTWPVEQYEDAYAAFLAAGNSVSTSVGFSGLGHTEDIESDLADCSSDYESALSDIEDLQPTVYSFGLRNQRGPYHDEIGFDDGEEFIPIEDDNEDELECISTSIAVDLDDDAPPNEASNQVTSTRETISGVCDNGARLAADEVSGGGRQLLASTEAVACTDLVVYTGSEPNGDKLVDSGVEAPVIEQPLEDAGLSLASPAHSASPDVAPEMVMEFEEPADLVNTIESPTIERPAAKKACTSGARKAGVIGKIRSVSSKALKGSPTVKKVVSFVTKCKVQLRKIRLPDTATERRLCAYLLALALAEDVYKIRVYGPDHDHMTTLRALAHVPGLLFNKAVGAVSLKQVIKLKLMRASATELAQGGSTAVGYASWLYNGVWGRA